MRIGIFFGGPSREREVSFAGGRTVYQNLDRSLFVPVPIFVDSLGNFILIDEACFDHGAIREFYPPAQLRKPGDDFSIYAESLGPLTNGELVRLTSIVGQNIAPADLPKHIDFAFIAMHGTPGEDGALQGLLEWYGLPYSHSGLFGSALGMDKILQNELLAKALGQRKNQRTLTFNAWKAAEPQAVLDDVVAHLGLPVVVKAPHQGSSIGVVIIRQADAEAFARAVNQCFFRQEVSKATWNALSHDEKRAYVQRIANLDEGIGFPVSFEAESALAGDLGQIIYYHPQDLLDKLDDYFSYSDKPAMITAIDGEDEILFEEFISGKEFSCGVIADQHGQPIALPPTGIESANFDFQAKYKMATKKTMPVQVSMEALQKIHEAVRTAFQQLRFGACVRIDGFVTEQEEVLLHDPNTIPGMSPTSLIFKQMVEIGLNPTQALTYFIRASLQVRIASGKKAQPLRQMLAELDRSIDREVQRLARKTKVAVLFGGFARGTEESLARARQMFSRLAASTHYAPVPVLLSGSKNKHTLHLLPVNLLFKDTVDDIREAIFAEKHPLIAQCVANAHSLALKYAGGFDQTVRPTTYENLALQVHKVFVATDELSPSDPDSVQSLLGAVNVPYFGPAPEEVK